MLSAPRCDNGHLSAENNPRSRNGMNGTPTWYLLVVPAWHSHARCFEQQLCIPIYFENLGRKGDLSALQYVLIHECSWDIDNAKLQLRWIIEASANESEYNID
jgi:hypothetical protein